MVLKKSLAKKSSQKRSAPPPFVVFMHYRNKPTQEYSFDKPGAEASAVMFAMRYSRDLGIKAEVVGPDGNLVVAFKPRTYDVRAWDQAARTAAGTSILGGYDDPLRKQAVPKTPAKKSAPKKTLAKKPLRKA